jgi:alpha-N-arabinofuranosidase
LHGTPVTLEQDQGPSPTFVARRQENLRARIATRIDFNPSRDGEEAGLVLYRAPHQRYEIGVRPTVGGRREVFVRQTVGDFVSAVTASAPAPGKEPLLLQIEAEPTRYKFTWGTSADHLQPLGGAETRLLSTEVTGGFVGTYVGVYARAPRQGSAATPAAFDWFDYEGRD